MSGRARSRPRVGILGGGQLALMLAESLVALGADPAIYDPDPDAPARRRYALGASYAYEDRARLRAFLDGCDVVTYEFENVPADAIRRAAGRARFVPSLDVLAICQHRAREKDALEQAGAPTVAWSSLDDARGLRDALAAFGPAVVKTARGGYDGKGQRRYARASEARAAHFPAGAPLVLEEPIEIAREVSCIVAVAGERVVSLPLFENAHRHHILDVTLCPARLPDGAARRVRRVAEDVARMLGVEGLLTVEFFLGRGRPGHGLALPGLRERLYVNELAPRPHNSGHVSRVACDRSQFDLLARVLLGMPIVAPRLVSDEVAFMLNLLGDRWPSDERRVFGALAADARVRELFLYGKREARPGRKMGHLAGFARDHAHALALVASLRKRAGG